MGDKVPSPVALEAQEEGPARGVVSPPPPSATRPPLEPLRGVALVASQEPLVGSLKDRGGPGDGHRGSRSLESLSFLSKVHRPK